MNTIKEKIAPLFQDLAKSTGERRFNEACSMPWFVHDWKPGGAQPVLPPEKVRMPFRGMLLVLRVESVMVPVYVQTDEGSDQPSEFIFPVGKGWVFCGEGLVTKRTKFLSAESASKAASSVWAGIKNFAGALNHPKIHVAKVLSENPKRKGQWMKAQEHYVLLHADHPANCSDVEREIEYDEAAVLARMVHWVRGHERVFRHPKFINMRGLKIWIQQQWRGPKEWINKRSRQLYAWVDKKNLMSA